MNIYNKREICVILQDDQKEKQGLDEIVRLPVIDNKACISITGLDDRLGGSQQTETYNAYIVDYKSDIRTKREIVTFTLQSLVVCTCYLVMNV